MIKVAILAGEPSGDLIASQLMSHINAHNKNVKFVGVGGPLMKKQGLSSFFDYSHLSVRGYFEVIKHIPKLLFLRHSVIKYLKKEKPSIFIGVDAPDFNLNIEKKLKEYGIPTFHYVAPSVWAWRANRINEISKCVNHLFAIFPNEPKLFNVTNTVCTYVGHPLAKKIPLKPNKSVFRTKLKLKPGSRIIALLPGSRMGELKWHMSLMLKTALLLNNSFKDLLFLIPVNNKPNLDFANKYLRSIPVSNLKLIIGHSGDVINSSDFVIAASGTATLESALYKKPMIITYRSSTLSYLGWKILRLIPYIGLPNIMLKKEIVPEILQNNATPEILAKKTVEILSNKVYLKKLKKDYLILHKRLKRDTSQLIFKRIRKHLK